MESNLNSKINENIDTNLFPHILPQSMYYQKKWVFIFASHLVIPISPTFITLLTLFKAMQSGRKRTVDPAFFTAEIFYERLWTNGSTLIIN